MIARLEQVNHLLGLALAVAAKVAAAVVIGALVYDELAPSPPAPRFDLKL